MKKDNTVGSRSKIELAYIAGFLDGDGSLMLQIKKRKDGKAKFRFMTTICFYQDSRHSKPLYWIKKKLGIGYISIRNDGITELRINGYTQAYQILNKLLPFIRFKKKQAETLYNSAMILSRTNGKLNEDDTRLIIKNITTIQKNNYATRKKKSESELLKILGMTP